MRMSSEELKKFYLNYKRPLNADGTYKLIKNFSPEELSDYRRVYNHKWRLNEVNKEKANQLALLWYHNHIDGGAYQKKVRSNRKNLI